MLINHEAVHSKLLLAGLFGSVSLFNTTSANAAITGCASGTSGQALWSDIQGPPNFTCTIDDKTYSNFTYSSVFNVSRQPTSGIDPSDQFAFSTIGLAGLTHNLNVQSANSYMNTVVSLAYTVTRVVPPNLFKRFSGNITGDNGTSWALSIAATNAGTSATTGYPTLGQSATTPTVNYNPNTISSTLTNTLIADQNGMGVTQLSNRLTQAVPGPLPLLGAGAALAFSRKLRARTKLAA